MRKETICKRTALIAEYSLDNPIVGILGGFDVLPGLSQNVSTGHHEAIPNGP